MMVCVLLLEVKRVINIEKVASDTHLVISGEREF